MEAPASRQSPPGAIPPPSPDGTLDATAALARRLAILDAITAALSEADDLPGLLDRSLATVLEVTGVDGGCIFLFNDITGDLRLTLHRGVSERFVESFSTDPGPTLLRMGRDPNTAVIVRDLSTIKVRSVSIEEGIRSFAGIPLHVRGQVLGVMLVVSRTLTDFAAADVALLVSIGRQIGLAIERARLYERERRRAQQLASINEVSKHLSTLLNERELLPAIVRSVREHLGYESATLALLDTDRNELVGAALSGFRTDERAGRRIPVDPEHSIMGWVVTHCQPLLANDVSREPRFMPYGPDDPTRAELAVPIQLSGRILGLLDVQSSREHVFHESDIAALQAVAAQVAIAIENARLYEATRLALKRTRAFQEVTTAITAVLDLHDTLERSLDAAMDIFQADRAGIYLVDPDTHRMGWIATRHLSEDFVAAVRAFFADVPMFSVLNAERSLYYEDISRIRGLPPALMAAVEREGFATNLSIPLRHGDEALGIFCLYHDQVRHYSDEEIHLAESFAGQAAIAIQHARLFDAERRARRQTATILDATRAVTSSLQLDGVLAEAAHCIAAALHQRYCAVWLLDDDRTAFHPAFRVAGAPNPEMDAVFRSLPPILVDSAPRFRALADAGASFVVEATDDLTAVEQEIQRLMPFSKYIAVPLAARDRVVGAAAIPIRRADYHVDPADLDVAAAIARSVALAIENARLYEQSQQLAVVEERNRLARELHDSVTHSLFSITLIAQTLPRILERDPTQARERIDRLTELGRGALAEMRALLFELRPAALQNEGLTSALTKHVAAFESREQIAVDLHVEGDRRAPGPVEEAALRVAQEALHNVAKHARATRVQVRLVLGEAQLELLVADNGTGFDRAAPAPNPRSLGLTSMRERAALLGGACEIDSAPGQGTTVRFHAPLGGGSASLPLSR